ncbi:nuclear transport factor 2 family protein [Mycobacterium sp. pUA109]|uniref:nuclear transport factor 2 family protein n=1 Tax=Mycobacterium sp. pUA109 TaxID=3238982 RepID=UPI00351BE5A0
MSAADVVKQAIAAILAADIEGLASVLHPDVEATEPASLPYGGTYQGREAFLEGLMPALVGPFELDPLNPRYFEGDGSAAVQMDLKFTSRRTGKQLTMPYVEVYEIHSGLIQRLTVYPQDTATLATFLKSNA